mgnify:CR=1 FL=1
MIVSRRRGAVDSISCMVKLSTEAALDGEADGYERRVLESYRFIHDLSAIPVNLLRMATTDRARLAGMADTVSLEVISLGAY